MRDRQKKQEQKGWREKPTREMRRTLERGEKKQNTYER